MKRIIFSFFIIFLLFCWCFTAQAQSLIFVSAQNVEAKNNRLFNIEIYTYCSQSLAAATFEIAYDNSIIEYRSVSTDISDAQVKSEDKNGKLTAIFLKEDGVNKNKNIKLFSVKFKSINAGDCGVKIFVSDCVDNNAKNFSGDTEAMCKVTVQESSSATKNDSDNKSGEAITDRKDDKTNSYKNETQSENLVENKAENKKYLSVIPDNSKEQEKYLLIILLFAIIIVAVGILFTKRMSNIEKKLNIKTEEQNTGKESPQNIEENLCKK